MTAIKRFLEFCVSPVGILTILFFGGLVMAAFRKTSTKGRRMVWTAAVIFLLILWTPLTELIVAPLERPFRPVRQVDPRSGVRAVVVLAGYGEDDGALPDTARLWPDTTARMVEGIRLYRTAPGTKLVLSGGVLRTGDRPVAQLMADFAVSLGVPSSDVVTERSSQTTYENLREVKKIISDAPFVLVETGCDLRRSTAVARRLGMKPIPAPADIWAAHHYPAGMTWKALGWRMLKDLRPGTTRLTRLQWANHEYLGYVWYWMLRRV